MAEFELFDSNGSDVAKCMNFDSEPVFSGYVNINQNDEPIFSKLSSNLRFPGLKIVDFTIGNDIGYLCLSNGGLLKFNFTKPDNPIETDAVDLQTKSQEPIYKIFCDQSGRHFIISFKSADSIYLSVSTKKIRPLTKLKGHLITCIAWNLQSSFVENSMKTILIGTNKGCIYEMELEIESRFFTGIQEKQPKLAFNLTSVEVSNDVNPKPITGLWFDSDTQANQNKIIIIVSTCRQLLQFFADVNTDFNGYYIFTYVIEHSIIPIVAIETPRSINFGGDLYVSKYIDICLNQTIRMVVWISGTNIHQSYINLDDIVSRGTIIDSFKNLGTTELSNDQPLSIILTRFHCIILYSSRIIAINIISNQIVYDDSISRYYGVALKLTYDSCKDRLYLVTDQQIYYCPIIKEERNAWKLYLEKKMFEQSKLFCQNEVDKINTVLIAQAENLYSEKKYKEAANIFSQTLAPFESTALMFISLETSEPLELYLDGRLESFKDKHITQKVVLLIWISDLILCRIDNASSNEIDSLQNRLWSILSREHHKPCISTNRIAFYEIFERHINDYMLNKLMMYLNDYEAQMILYERRSNWKSSLKILNSNFNIKLIKRHLNILMINAPVGTVDLLIQHAFSIDLNYVLPCLDFVDTVTYAVHIEQSIKFLKFLVYEMKCQQSSVHNRLISFLIITNNDTDLLLYLEQQNLNTDDSSCYDSQFALRMCKRKDNKHACVLIYRKMNLFEEAVDLALEFDENMAKICANESPSSDINLRRKLWLKIAKHVITKDCEVSRVTSLLNECTYLKIEDLLPFYPDFDKIDMFKDAICSSLNEYSQTIDKLKQRIEDSANLAETIRNDTQMAKKKFIQITSVDLCYFCEFPLLTRPFYAFSCNHFFHQDCLLEKKSIMSAFNNSRNQFYSTNNRDRLMQLLTNIHQLNNKKDKDMLSKDPMDKSMFLFKDIIKSTIGLSSSLSTLNIESSDASSILQMKKEIDEIVCQECFLCGEDSIESIDKSILNAQSVYL